MNVITLKLPDDLNAALNEVSRKRGLSKSAVDREALQQSLLAQGASRPARPARPSDGWRSGKAV